MITENEFIEDLENLIKKSEILVTIYLLATKVCK